MLTTESRNYLPGEPIYVRILVVDDNARVRDGLRLILQNHADWKVCGEAANGIEAIEKYRELRPDLLVIDVSMPQMNGLDAAQEILKLFPKTLILLYTSFLTSQLIDVAHKAGIMVRIFADRRRPIYSMPSQALLPDPRNADWVIAQVRGLPNVSNRQP